MKNCLQASWPALLLIGALFWTTPIFLYGADVALENLQRDLQSPALAVRQQAAKLLGRAASEAAVPALMQALQDSQPEVRREAAHSLGTIKNAQATPALIQALADQDMNVRTFVAYALGEIKAPQAAQPLLKTLRDPEWQVRDQAAWALREIRDPQLVGALVDMIAEPNADKDHILWLLKSPGYSTDARAQKVIALMAPKPAVKPAAKPDDGGPAAWWNFDDRSTAVAKDKCGATDGEIKSCTVVEGKAGAALKFGKGKFVELGKPAKLPVMNQGHTIMAWVKTEAKNGVVVARGGAFCGFSLYAKDALPKFGIRRIQGGPLHLAAGTQPIGADWVHLAGVIQKDQVELYVNGKLAATDKSAGYLPNNCGQGMEIGTDVGNTAVEITDAFEGVIDEVMAFTRALTPAEITKWSGIPTL
jgi:hypothetical protein